MTVVAQQLSASGAAATRVGRCLAALALARARKDLQNAVLMGRDSHRHRQYALSARDEAATVLLAADATGGQRRYARIYFTAAQLFLAAEEAPRCDRVNDCMAAR